MESLFVLLIFKSVGCAPNQVGSSRFKIRHPDVMWMGFLDVGCWLLLHLHKICYYEILSFDLI